MRFSKLAPVLAASAALWAAPALARAGADGQGDLPLPAPSAPAAAGALAPKGSERPGVGQPPAWVEIAPLPKPPSGADGAATIDLLGDVQIKFSDDNTAKYYAFAWIIGTAEGLDSGSLKIDWDPSLEDLTIHRYRVLRGGQAIDLLGDGSGLKILQREARMEVAMLDGRLTATMQPEDLRVGDTVELSYTVVRRDPALQGHAGYLVGPSDGATLGRFRVRMLWDRNRPVQWRAYPGVLQPKIRKTALGTELTADLFDTTAPRAPEDAPSRFRIVNAVEVSDFKDWAGVSRLFAPLYADASALAADSPLKAEAARIAAQTSDPQRRAELALDLVQRQVRYLFLGMNAGGMVPAKADQTWARRFGDCKGKTVLLIALLRELGIEAHPVLVNTEEGDVIGSRMPSAESFDHVIVQALVGGKSYFLDGTRLGDTRLSRLEVPNYRFGLPVKAAGSSLIPMVPAALTRPASTVTLTLDASQGIDVPAPANAEMRFTGQDASDVRQKFAGFSSAERTRELRKVWRERFDSIAPVRVATHDDPATGDFVMTMSGTAQMEWSKDLGTRWYEVDRSRLGWRFNTARESEINSDAPFAFAYPDWWSSKVTIKLPHDGKGFRVQGGETIDRTVGDLYQFRRIVTLGGGALTMEAHTRALTGELAADRAPKVRSELLELAGSGVYIRMPDDYAQTDAERALSRKSEEAEVKAREKARGR